MCRNIRVLYNFQPPTTADEIRAAALQYVRKVSGMVKPPKADEEAFAAAVDAVARSTEELLEKLTSKGRVRTREDEIARARMRWARRNA